MAAVAGHQPAIEPDWSQNLSTSLICPECKEDPPNLIEEYSAGDMVCADCGLVVGQRIVDMSSEWRTFSNDDQNNDDPSRVGDAPNLLLNGDQLSTEVAMGDGKLSKDLRRAQNRTVNDKNNKALTAAYKQIAAFCEQMNLPSTIPNHAKSLYKELIDDPAVNRIKTKPLEVIAAGLIFIACREFDVGRTFREVHNITSVSKKEIGKVFKLIVDWRQKMINEKKGTNLPTKEIADTGVTGKKCADLVIRFNNVIGINERLAWRIELLAKRVDELGTLAGRSPLSAAGAVIYFMTCLYDEPKNIKIIADTTGVSDSTIRTAYALLYNVKDDLVKPDWLEKDGIKMENLPVP